MARKRNNTGRARKGTGSIRQKQNKRKNGTVTESYEIRFSLGSGADRVQKSESYSLKSEAEARLLLIESIIAAGKSAHKSIEEICAELSRSVESNDDVEMIAAESETSADFSTATKSFFDDWTLDEWFDYWVTNFVVGGAESTPRKYRNDYRLYISPHIGSKKLREILPVDIQLMVNKWRDPQYKIKKILSKKYVKDIHSFLKTCFKQAKENNLIAKNPCSKTVLPKITKADKILIKFKCSIKEVGKILAVLRDAPHDRLYKFAIGFGLRILENLALTMQDIDMVNHVIHLRFQLRKDLSEKIHYDDGESLHFRTLKDADPRDIVFDDEIAAILQAQIDSEKAKKKRLVK